MRLFFLATLMLLVSGCASAPPVSSAVIDGLALYVQALALACGAPETPDECALAADALIAAYDRAAGLR